MSNNDENLTPLNSGPGTEGYVFREAVTNPGKLVMVAGVWIVFVPAALMGAGLAWLTLSDKDIPFSLLGVAIFLLSAAVIVIATRNYFDLRRKKEH